VTCSRKSTSLPKTPPTTNTWGSVLALALRSSVGHSNRRGSRRRGGSRQCFRAGATHETWACYHEHDAYQHPLPNHRKHGETQVAVASHFRGDEEQVGRPMKEHGDQNASAGVQENPGEEDRLRRYVREE